MSIYYYPGIHKVFAASSTFMSNVFSAAVPSGSGAPLAIPPDTSNINTNSRNDNSDALPPPQQGFPLPYPAPAFPLPLPSQEIPPTPPGHESSPAKMVSSSLDNSHDSGEFQAYNPAQKPEARSSRGPPKRTPAQSPDDKSAASGRKRTRTKVVAWDPKDLEDIYDRKENQGEDWDSICRVGISLFRSFNVLAPNHDRIIQPERGLQ